MHMNLEEFSYELVAPSHIPFVVVMFLTSYVCYICCNVFGYIQCFQAEGGGPCLAAGAWLHPELLLRDLQALCLGRGLLRWDEISVVPG